MNPYESWLIRQRLYCEDCPPTVLVRATRVIQRNGRDTVVCEMHGRRSIALKGKKERQAPTKKELQKQADKFIKWKASQN